MKAGVRLKKCTNPVRRQVEARTGVLDDAEEAALGLGRLDVSPADSGTFMVEVSSMSRRPVELPSRICRNDFPSFPRPSAGSFYGHTPRCVSRRLILYESKR